MKNSFVLFALMAMVLLQLVVGHPVQVKPTKKRRDDAHDPEAAAKELNGPLPEGLEQSNGLAINATEYPSTVANALSPSNASQVRLAKSASTSSESEVRQATAAEIDEHTFYTKLSASSYCRGVIPGGKFDCKHCDQSLTLVKTFTTTLQDTNAMVLRGDGQKTIYIVFRGTNSIRSFVVDAVFIPVNYPLADGTKVHKGFLDSYNAVRDDLVKTIQEQADQYPDYKFVVTGHSLGGAQGVLCAVDLFNLNQTRYGVDNLEIFTQGEPRVGDIEFAHYLMNTQLPHERLVHKRDIVPHLPPGFMNFLHSGTEFWINNEGIQVCPNGIETDFCSNSIVPFTSLLDHFTYLDINVGLCL